MPKRLPGRNRTGREASAAAQGPFLRWRAAHAQGAWRIPLVALGRNAMLIYVLSMLVPRLLELLRWREGEGWATPMTALYDHVFAVLPGDPRFGSMAFALAVTAAFAALAIALDRRG